MHLKRLLSSSSASLTSVTKSFKLLSPFSRTMSTYANFIAPGAESTFDESVTKYAKEAAESKKDLYVLITAAKDATGQSWCPDCRNAEPLIKKAFDGPLRDQAILVAAAVERAAYKGQPPAPCDGDSCVRNVAAKHPYKTNPKILVPALPTLYKWDTAKDTSSARLVEEDCYDVTKLTSFLGIASLD